MLNMNNLHFSYGKKELFSNLCLEVASGRIHGLLGLNGAGKTTLMKLVCGLNFPTSGNIQAMDFQPRARDPHFLSRVYMLFEEPHVPNISNRDFPRIFTRFYPAFDKDYFEHCLSKFQLPQQYTTGKLSFGQKKKLMLSFALSCGTDILLLDEPTNGLDIPSKVTFRELMADRISPDRIVILSTHQVREVESLMSSVIILNNGAIIFNAKLEEIKASLRLTRSEEAPSHDSPHLVHTEIAAGVSHSIWQKHPSDPDTETIPMDFELLFNATITAPEKFLHLAGEKPAGEKPQ